MPNKNGKNDCIFPADSIYLIGISKNIPNENHKDNFKGEKYMKKRLVTLFSLMLALVIAIASLAGCNLVTTDSDKDMEQVVATVQISDDADKDEIKKKDMILGYLNYGYMYVQHYGYTQKRTFELILDNLISTRIIVQEAMITTPAKNIADADTTAAYPVAKFLDETQLRDAKYNAVKAMNDLMSSVSHDHEEAVGDSTVGSVRTVPSGATNAEKKTSDAEKNAYIADTNAKTSLLLKDMDTEHRKESYNGVVKLFKNNGLLGGYDNKDLKTTDYYKQTLKSYYENELITAYEKSIEDAERAKYDFNAVAAKYTEIYNKQKNWSESEFIAALESTTATEPIVYSAFGNYGYVYNLLLGVNDYQKEEIDKIRTDNDNISDEAYDAIRAKILKDTVVYDQRSSWILAGYDGKYDESKKEYTFAGDYTFAKDSANSLPFQGVVNWLNKEDEIIEKDDQGNEWYGKDEHGHVYAPQYGVESVKYFGLEEFLIFMNGYLNGTDTAEDYSDLGAAVYDGKIHKFSSVSEYDAKVKELIFAFSTDSGSLSNQNGYVIKPAVDGGNSETYVTTFAKAGRKLLESGSESYVIVASDYGYHVMFFAKKLDIKSADLKEYLKAECGVEDPEAYFADMMADYADFEDKDNYLYVLTDSIVSTAVSNAKTKKRNELVNKYRYEESGKVTVYADRYSDLVG